MMTEGQKQRTIEMMGVIAKEDISIEEICNSLYVYGSEIACLRIFAHSRCNGSMDNPKVRVGFSQNLNTWYVSIEK